MFQLGDKVIYPGQGVAVIKDTVEKSVAGKPLKFFKLEFLYKDMTILIPIGSNPKTCGIRHLCNPGDVDRAFKELGQMPKRILDASDFTPSSWNKRNKDYQLKIQGGDLLDIASIYRDLMYISQQKELSFGEKGLLQMTEELLTQEIILVTQRGRESIIGQLRSYFQHMAFPAGIEAAGSTSATLG